MTPFAEIEREAIIRSGGKAMLAKLLPKSKSAKALKSAPDDRYLSLMCRRIFRAGLNHTVVDAKWPAFETVFKGFDPKRVRAMSDEALEKLMADARIIRHWGKIKAVRENAQAMCAFADQPGGFGAWLADWPGTRMVALWAEIADRFSQMGGNSTPRFLRMAGKDTFVLTGDVARALVHWGGIPAKTKIKGKAGREAAEEAFNHWALESGRKLGEISMILARSID